MPVLSLIVVIVCPYAQNQNIQISQCQYSKVAISLSTSQLACRSNHNSINQSQTIQLTSARTGHHNPVHVSVRRSVSSIRDLEPHQPLKASLLKNLVSQAFLKNFGSPKSYLKGSSLPSSTSSLTLSASLRPLLLLLLSLFLLRPQTLA